MNYLERPKHFSKRVLVASIAAVLLLAFIAISRSETINAIWFLLAAICCYVVAYRFYASFICAKVLTLDPTRACPAERFRDDKDFIPTNKWIVFGHHFAAIAGPGPLIGPTLAAQFGYLPGTLWILFGAILGGAVQDMLILFFSTRRDGKSLGQIAKDELGPVAGFTALIGTLMIIIILISVLGLVVVKAMKHSPWATFTVASTIPIAVLVGLYMQYFRPGKVLEASILGLVMILGAVIGGQYVAESQFASMFDLDGLSLAYAVIIYGFLAATLPVWLLLAPRDYLSTYLKLGTIFLLLISILILRPEIQMPAITSFIDGTGPIFAGKIFPFMFITIACGAISGFHSLVASGTTPKILANERDIRLIGYGSMLLESLVALMAMLAACVLEPGIYFAINSPASIVGENLQQVAATINSWGYTLDIAAFEALSKAVGESSLLARTGGAPSLAVGMASIFSSVFGNAFLGIWYHFAIMFEAVFILTTLDAGTRVARFMLQDLLGNIYKPLGKTTSYLANIFASFCVVVAWGYFLYLGVIDPNGGVNMLWPIFGIANQMLAAIALCIATTIMIKSDKIKYLWITLVPLAFVAVVTSAAVFEKFTSNDPRIGYFAAIRNLEMNSAIASPQLIFNQYVIMALSLIFLLCLYLIVFCVCKLAIRYISGYKLSNSESEYIQTQLTIESVSMKTPKKKIEDFDKINRCC
jgi:carbon starvation protein